MDQAEKSQKVEELKWTKDQLKAWRWGIATAVAFVVIVSVANVNSAFKGLTQKGPAQDKYVSLMTYAVKDDIAPMVEGMTRETLQELKPEVQASLQKVNNRMPEVAQAALDELDALQASLPVKGETVLSSTFGEMLAKKETKLQEMFPEATPEQIERLLMNLGESSGEQAGYAAMDLFGEHHLALRKIHVNLGMIAEQEKPSLAGVDPTWEMGLLVLDLFREEAEAARPDKNVVAPASNLMAKEVSDMKATKVVKK